MSRTVAKIFDLLKLFLCRNETPSIESPALYYDQQEKTNVTKQNSRSAVGDWHSCTFSLRLKMIDTRD